MFCYTLSHNAKFCHFVFQITRSALPLAVGFDIELYMWFEVSSTEDKVLPFASKGHSLFLSIQYVFLQPAKTYFPFFFCSGNSFFQSATTGFFFISRHLF